MWKLFFALLLMCCANAAVSCDAHDGDEEDESACQEFWNVEVDEADAHVSSNVELLMDEYMNPKESVKNISHDELLRLYRALKPLAAASFSCSRSRFEVMVRYTLWKDRQAHFYMQTNAGRPETEMLTKFMHEASILTNFHPADGKVWVLFDFEVSPKCAAGSDDSYMAYELRDFPWQEEPPKALHGG